MHNIAVQSETVLCDEESSRGRFGWVLINEEYVPYIFRGKKEEIYVSVRIMDQIVQRMCKEDSSEELLHLYQTIDCIQTCLMTESEAKLMNEINELHCDNHFCKKEFKQSSKLIRLKDAEELIRYMSFCKDVVTNNMNHPFRCGFIQINKSSTFPFIRLQDKKYIPLFFFDEVKKYLSFRSIVVKDWDLAYLQICCKLQGIKNNSNQYISEVIPMDEINKCFPSNSIYQECWPYKETLRERYQEDKLCSPSKKIIKSREINGSNFNDKKRKRRNVEYEKETIDEPILCYPDHEKTFYLQLATPFANSILV